MFCLKILNGQEKVVFLTFPKTLEISLLWYIKPIKVKYITIQKKKALKENYFRDLQHILKPIECTNITLAQYF